MDLSQLKIPTDFSTLSDADLANLHSQAFALGQPLAEKINTDEELTDDEQAAFDRLADVVTNARAEKARRVTDAAGANAKGAKAKTNAKAFATAPDDEDADEDDPADAEKPPPVKKSVVAGAAKRGKGLQGPQDGGEDAGTSRMLAAANLPDYANGHQFANMLDVAKAIDAQFSTMPVGAPGKYIKTPVMYLKREFDPELTLDQSKVNADGGILAVLDHAADQTREGVSLTAAAGWCAPSQIDYGLLELETTAGMWDAPEVNIARGGLQFTTGPDFSAIFGGAGYFHQTEGQVIAATAKPTMVVPCPSFTEVRLEVEGVSITGAFLQDRGYPEMVRRFTRGAMTAHAHKLNIFKLNKVVAGSTLFDYTNVANLPVTASESKDLTVLSRLLAFVGVQIMDFRYKYRMAETAMLEAVMPYWVVEQVRQDVQRRTGQTAEEAFSVAVDQIKRWFSIRGARVQFVYDWLDVYNTTNASTVGQTAGVYTLPTTVDVLLYPAGTWVVGVADVIRLDTVYDSTNLALNSYQALFTEEGVSVMKRGFESRRIRATISPSGATAATINMVQG
jgi:hypothetical protein